MTTRGQQGGPRQPANPAPVSGPGALSQRTDGGPGNQKQPVRVASGGAYGERAAAIAQQQAAPMAAGSPTSTGGTGGTPAAGGSPASGAEGVFGPTARPSEPITAGAMGAGGQPQLTPDELFRILYQKRPSPWLARLMR